MPFSSYNELFVTYFNQLRLHLATLLGVAPFEFRSDLWYQKIRVPGLSCGVVCVILSLTVFIQYQRVTEGQTCTQTHDDSSALA